VVRDGKKAAAARAALAALWGVQARVEFLPGDMDDNFAVVEPDGRRSVLKLVHRSTPPAEVDLQVAALTHLAGRIGALEIPTVLPTRSGEPTGRTDDGRIAWRLDFVPGRPLAGVRPRSPALLRDLGRALGRVVEAFGDFDHPAAGREHGWDLARAGGLAAELHHLPDAERRARVAGVLTTYEGLVAPRLGGLPRTVIHGDANDHNVFVEPGLEPARVVGLIDFGDMVRSHRICEAAVAGAYALFDTDDVLVATGALLAGFDEVVGLGDDEIDLFLPLVETRLAMSVLRSARRRGERPDDPYVTVSEADAWKALDRLAGLHPTLARARMRTACGRAGHPDAPALEAWLTDPVRRFHPVLGRVPAADEVVVVDLSVGSPLVGPDPERVGTRSLTPRIDAVVAGAGASVGVGRWDEARALYLVPDFQVGPHPIDGFRTVHLGIDLYVPPGTPLHAPLVGTVVALGDNGARDYGPVLVLEHQAGPDGPRFRTLWGHLDAHSIEQLEVGRRLEGGERLATVGDAPDNGDWTPHLHLQIVLDDLGLGLAFPGVAVPDERDAWLALSPDPTPLAGLGALDARAPRSSPDDLVQRRRRVLGPNLSLSYRPPLHLVRGRRALLWDAAGRPYLDFYNNVQHVGHQHPRVVEAVRRQAGLLNTNTRYLHELPIRYAERLSALLPAPLEVVWLLNSASEANELALRIARTVTSRDDVVVLEGGYHGHTGGLVAVSPYKFGGPGGAGRPDHVHVAPLPDPYRGIHRGEGPDLGERYAREVERVLDAMARDGRAPAAFLAETFPSVAGQIVPPAGFLAGAYAAVRAAGGLCIADEVQTGMGRLGRHFWGFDHQGVVPDLVVLGKPLGNGFPLAALVTTREIADAFDTGMEFFSTFGGNPVACAAGMAVLDVLADEALPERAAELGDRLRAGLLELQRAHALLGDVRGLGLFQGVAVVADSATREPDPVRASRLVHRLRHKGVLAGTDGLEGEVVKLRGPLVLEPADVDRLLHALADVLDESAFREDH
jgi:4-aminobutyrate aminotransferase-like enzyme/Ser/Thr protein kinase RdoA (MazF antagonist)